jgi:thiosulfate dehydrogenase [quinone] large subunit
VTCVTFQRHQIRPQLATGFHNQRDAMRLPGSILQGILARAALVLLRIYLGVIFLLAAWPKLRGDFTPHLIEFLEKVALERGHPFYQEFVHRFVLPNASLVASLVTWGELLVGLTLILGLMTRLSATLALLLVVNYMFAKGAWFWQASSNDAAFAVIAVALLIGAAGRTFGLDALLAKRWPKSPFW